MATLRWVSSSEDSRLQDLDSRWASAPESCSLIDCQTTIVDGSCVPHSLCSIVEVEVLWMKPESVAYHRRDD